MLGRQARTLGIEQRLSDLLMFYRAHVVVDSFISNTISCILNLLFIQVLSLTPLAVRAMLCVKTCVGGIQRRPAIQVKGWSHVCNLDRIELLAPLDDLVPVHRDVQIPCMTAVCPVHCVPGNVKHRM